MDKIGDRLRRLGLGKGPSALKPPSQRHTAKKVENLIEGHLFHDGNRSCFVAEYRYPLGYLHGNRPLNGIFDLTTKVPAQFTRDPSLSTLSFQDMLFIDTETTGLSSLSGTIAFLVGIGFFEGDVFTVQQLFLRSPDDEPAMLSFLNDAIDRKPGFISFNGRAFDLPLLENRYILNRRKVPFSSDHHLDLLHPARRLWRNSLDSCRLVVLEEQVLGVTRDQADVPSGIIPLIYRDYLQTGNGIEMTRIFYHNRIDVLSMVGLTDLLCRAFHGPESILADGQTWYSLGRWYESLKLVKEAENAYRQALTFDIQIDQYRNVLFDLGRLIKRSDRSAEAADVWQQLAAIEIDGVRGHVELAKYHEWVTGDLDRAADWTRRAIELVQNWSDGLQRVVKPDLVHRLDRLERKIERYSGDSGR